MIHRRVLFFLFLVNVLIGESGFSLLRFQFPESGSIANRRRRYALQYHVYSREMATPTADVVEIVCAKYDGLYAGRRK